MKLSLIIAGYKHPEVWSRALSSIEKIPLADVEFLCVEDGGGDDRVMDLLNRYHREDSRFVPIYRENGGVCCARNTALDVARGDWVGFMDYDDEVNPHIYVEAIDFLNQNLSCDVCTFGVNTIWPDIHLQDPVSLESERIFSEKGSALYWAIDQELFKKRLLNYVWNKLYRRSFITEHHIRFEPHSVCFEDIIFNLDCLCAGAVMGAIPGIGYYWLRPSSGSTLGRYRPWINEGLSLDYERKEKWAQYCGVLNDPHVQESLKCLRASFNGEIIRNLYRVNSPHSFWGRIGIIQRLTGWGFVKSFVVNIRGVCFYWARSHFYFKCIQRYHMMRTFSFVREYRGV